ncbi:fibropellin-1-like protein [Anopheles sinensis]|uniref:Fibropellin-1-like protein n=1 Tax=Anopheles sinensis TaxID=74873 RepID=A0A084VFT5_ANOSI|nr:fibropellin-1-like protein [Anopheles sinensis]
MPSEKTNVAAVVYTYTHRRGRTPKHRQRHRPEASNRTAPHPAACNLSSHLLTAFGGHHVNPAVLIRSTLSINRAARSKRE